MPSDSESTLIHTRRGVFISYARSDGEVFATDLRQKLEAAGIPLWQDRVKMEGGRDWWLQITDALDHVAFMALVVTPNALKSDIVRKEWRYARQQGVCVYPIVAAPNLDFASMPRWMRDQHFYDLNHQWDKFIADLKKPCETPRVPFMVEDLPEDFVARPGEYDQLVTLLLDQQREEPIAITAALRGAGGYGKTTLAKALCHDERIQEAFDDGILWVTLGENPGDLTSRVETLIQMLSGESPKYNNLTAAVTRLKELLADRDLLIVIDDVWNKVHLEPFTQGGPRCARLITTRNFDILPNNAQQVKVDAMQPGEAILLLGAKLTEHSTTRGPTHGEDAIDRELRALAERLGHWPLLVKLVNGTLHSRLTQSHQPLLDAIAYVNKALDKRGLKFFDDRDPQARYRAVALTLGVSFDQLKEHELLRFRELAIFPEDVNIPFGTLERYWGLDDFDTEELCERYARLSLLLDFDPNKRTIRLHDVIRQYLNDEQRDQLAELHQRLLHKHRPPPSGPVALSLHPPVAKWADLPDDEPYLWDYLALHLIAAGRGEELVATVKDWRYLTKKTFLRKSQAVEKDLVTAVQIAPADDPLRTLLRNFVNTGHLFNHCGTQEDVKETVYVRLQHLQELKAMLQEMAEHLKAPHIEPQATLPDLPHPALIRTLEGHADWVNGCAFSPDGKWIVSASRDKTLKLWETATGQPVQTLEDADWVNGCAFSPDGKWIVSASHDNTLKIWEAATAQMVRSLEGHTNEVRSCVFSPDGKLIVSASWDGLKVWEAATGKLQRTLEDIALVSACAFSPDGKRIVSALGEGKLTVWEATTGQIVRTLEGHASWVNGCAFSPDGKLIVSASGDGTLKVWETMTWQVVRTLKGHADWVRSCAFSPDGKWIVSASHDKTLKLWETATGHIAQMLEGHVDWVKSCAFSPDGKLIVSRSDDRTLKVWEAATGKLQRTLEGHVDWVSDCAFSPDGKLIVSSSDCTLKVWEVGNGHIAQTLEGHADEVNGCAFSPNGKLILTFRAFFVPLPTLGFIENKGLLTGAKSAPVGSSRKRC
jgi:WD40 repeat protein